MAIPLNEKGSAVLTALRTCENNYAKMTSWERTFTKSVRTQDPNRVSARSLEKLNEIAKEAPNRS